MVGFSHFKEAMEFPTHCSIMDRIILLLLCMAGVLVKCS